MSPPAPAPDRRWLVCYFPAAWLGHVCQGLATGVLGPSQVSSSSIMVSLSPVPTLYIYSAVPGPGAGPARERPPDQPGVDSAGGGQLPGHSSHRGRVQVGDIETWHHHTWSPGPGCGPSTPRWSSSPCRCCWWGSSWRCSPGHTPSHCCSSVGGGGSFSGDFD